MVLQSHDTLRDEVPLWKNRIHEKLFGFIT